MLHKTVFLNRLPRSVLAGNRTSTTLSGMVLLVFPVAPTLAPGDHRRMLFASSPLWQNLLLEDPWPVALTLVIVAGVLAFLAYQRANRKLFRVAGVAVLGAIAIFFLTGLVTTTREKIMADTQALVGHTAPLNLPAFKTMVDPRVIVTVESKNGVTTIDGDAVFARLEATVGSMNIEKQTVLAIDALVRSADHATCTFDVRTDIRASGRGVSRWVLTWRKQVDGSWRVTEVRWIPVQHLLGIQPDAGHLR